MIKSIAENNSKLIQHIALLSCGITALQILVVVCSGEILCLNEGCRIVEKLTNIPPLFFNLAGFLYFLILFLLARREPGWSPFQLRWIESFLLAGLAVEGVLVGYQVFVVKKFCSYCLLIFLVIVLLNLLHGRRQFLLGAVLFLAVFTSFPLLNFGPTLFILRNESLNSGSFAVRRCEASLQQVYFFFSSDCPHCQNVQEALKDSNSCELYFNPVDRIQGLAIPELEYMPGYDPLINRLILGLLDIKTIPVLFVRNSKGLNIIEGEKSIVQFIGQACFCKDADLYSGSSQDERQEGISVFNEKEGGCDIQQDCPDPERQSQEEQFRE